MPPVDGVEGIGPAIGQLGRLVALIQVVAHGEASLEAHVVDMGVLVRSGQVEAVVVLAVDHPLDVDELLRFGLDEGIGPAVELSLLGPAHEGCGDIDVGLIGRGAAGLGLRPTATAVTAAWSAGCTALIVEVLHEFWLSVRMDSFDQ